MGDWYLSLPTWVYGIFFAALILVALYAVVKGK